MEDNKLFYTIGQVADLLGESTSLVRFWSTSFSDYIKPARNKKGNRLFTPNDLEYFRIIHHLVKERGMTLEGARMRLRDNRSQDVRTAEVVASLTRIKAGLQEIKDAL